MERELNRRQTLVGLAAGAGALAVGETALAQGKYKEAPALAELVKAGKLPSVDKRLPENPLVVPVVEKTGEYGGVWRRAFLGPADYNNYVRVVFDALFRFSPDGAKIEPKIAESAEPSADFKVWTIKLRKGSKWSDGQPFGADDILFWYNDVLLNKELTPTLPGWIKSPDGTAAKVEKVDDNTVRFTYAAPATLFLTAVANQDGADRTFAMFLPAHYLKKFHPTYTPKADVETAAKAAGFKTWTELFANKNAPPENPERPTMAAWAPTSRASDPVFTLKRNPYYIGVDKDGNQLPYIDEVRFTYFADVQALNLAAIAGNFDMQERHIIMTNYPVLKDQEKTGKYRVITWPTFGGADAVIAINQTYTADPEMGKVMARRTSGWRCRSPSTATRSRRACSWASVSHASRCPHHGIPTIPATNGPRSGRRSTATRPTRCWTASASTRRTPTASACCRAASPPPSRSAWCRRSAPGPTWRCWSPRTGRRSA